jgi:predicted PurR-regulated permease PerM
MSARNETLHLIVKAILIAALVAVLIVAAARLLDLLVLVFGAAVIAVLIRGLADAVERALKRLCLR